MTNPGGDELLPSHKEAKPIRSRKEVKPIRSLKEVKQINNDEPFLPDDIIMDIVSRLSTKDALRFQSVCKRAKSLMSTRDFIVSHIKRSCKVPMILVLSTPGNPEPYLLNMCWGSEASKNSKALKNFGLYPDHIVQFSHDGLIVSKNSKNPGIFIIFNPMYSHVVKITVPESMELQQQQSEIYGVFYQPLIKEYCTLWAFTVSVKPEPLKVQYKMLNLGSGSGSEPNWRDISNPWTQNGRNRNIRPVLVNGYLYWVVLPEVFEVIPINVDILEFDTRNEVFEVIPYPSAAIKGYSKFYNNLLQANGYLMLYQASCGVSPIDIWTLKSRSNKIWTHITVNVTSCRLLYADYTAVAFWNEELLLQSGKTASELYVCNLKLGKERNFGRAFGYRSFAPHVMSLASLENCKSDICMVEERMKNPVK